MKITIKWVVAVLAAFASAVYNATSGQEATYFANIAEGVHDASVTRVADAAIATRHLLYKKGAEDNSVAVNAAANTRPVGVVADEITADQITAGMQVAVLLLGKGPTKRMVASKAIAVGVAVYTAADGKVTDASAAGSFMLGTSLTAAAADGDVLEVEDCVPVIMAA